jgi:hypothetical protein
MIKNIFSFLFLYIISSTWVFACINDQHTTISESMWWKSYENSIYVDILIIILMMMIYVFFMALVIKKHNKKLTWYDKNNTIIKWLWVFVFMSYFSLIWWNDLGIIFFWIISAIYLSYYCVFWSAEVYTFLKENFKKNKLKYLIFWVSTLWFFPLLISSIILMNIFNLLLNVNHILFYQWFIILYWIYLQLVPFLITNKLYLKTLGVSSITVYLLLIISTIL